MDDFDWRSQLFVAMDVRGGWVGLADCRCAPNPPYARSRLSMVTQLAVCEGGSDAGLSTSFRVGWLLFFYGEFARTSANFAD